VDYGPRKGVVFDVPMQRKDGVVRPGCDVESKFGVLEGEDIAENGVCAFLFAE